MTESTDRSLTGQIAVITGGGSGIGLGIARALAAAGCRVAIAGRSIDRLRRAAESIASAEPVRALPCDVTRRDQVDQIFATVEAELGPVDILVNSAGTNVRARRMAELTPEAWDQLVRINLDGVFHCMQSAMKSMRPRGKGLIVNICSVAGKRALPLAGPGYCAAKFGVSALGMATAAEERGRGIRITTIYPGEVNTPILEQRPEPVPPERLAEMLQPDDLGKIVAFLAQLPSRVIVPEMVVVPAYQEYL